MAPALSGQLIRGPKHPEPRERERERSKSSINHKNTKTTPTEIVMLGATVYTTQGFGAYGLGCRV